jgi:hypothetical protein
MLTEIAPGKRFLAKWAPFALSHSPDDEYGKWDKSNLAVEITAQI